MLVLGLGSDLRGDDGAGLRVIRVIRERAAAAGIAAREHPGDPLGLVWAWQGRAAVVIVDAMRWPGEAPGSVARLEKGPTPLPLRAAGRGSTHAASIAEAAELARALGRLPPRLIVYGVQGEQFALGAGLSAPVHGVLPELAARVLSEAGRLAGAAEPVPNPGGGGGRLRTWTAASSG